MSGSAGAARDYYSHGLSRGDYYISDEMPGVWCGKAAEMLGLCGEVGREDFRKLCDNIRPCDGGKLNPRFNTKRRVGYDMVFSAPKSVSIMQGVLGDERITEAFQNAVRRVMLAIEADIHVRVRKNGANSTRRTGNMVWGEFTHFTSRPVDEKSAPDPNLHIHAYCFNTSFDIEESRFKAGEFFYIKREAPFYEAMFHSELATELQQLDYQIENQPFSFEIAGVGKENIRRFSRRAREIEALAEELGIADNDRAKDKLAATTRKRKSVKLTKEQVKTDWQSRLVEFENPGLRLIISPQQAVDYALAKNFERKSVVSWRRLVADALQSSIGDCRTAEIEEELYYREEILTAVKDEAVYVTTEMILAEEKEVLDNLRFGKSMFLPLNPDYVSTSKDADQKAAIEALVKSRDQIFVIHGRAGTGKTTLMKEAVKAIGGNVYTFAPTSEAAHKVLKGEGFENSDTIQQLLLNQNLQAEMRDSVMWVDEAGLLSVTEINRLLDIANRQNARLILSGDINQHRSVERGDGLRLVIQSGCVEVKETRQIYRQRNANYRQAVAEISRGNPQQGLKILEKMGAIIECADLKERCQKIAAEFVDNPDALIISPTHAEADLLTATIRKSLKRAGKLGDDVKAIAHIPRNLTEAERKNPLFLAVGDIVKFHQNAKGGFKKGSAHRIEHIGEDGKIWLSGYSNRLQQLNPEAARHYNIYREAKLPLSVGDKIRLTRNIKVNGKRLFNGSIHSVTRFDGRNPITECGTRLPNGSFTYGYVSTSHSAQGKTANKLIISQTSMSAVASSLEQFYVSVSRGRDEIKIFTDSQAELSENIKSSGQRLLAVELTGAKRQIRSEEEEVKRRRKLRRLDDERRRSQIQNRQFGRAR